MTCFAAYGLTFASEIPIPDVTAADGHPDVQVVRGAVPATLAPATAAGPSWWTSPRQTLISMAGIGRFLVENGSRITVDPAAAAHPSDVVLGLTGGAFGPLLHQRGRFLLHAATVAFQGRIVACAGHSGSGKSTLLLALLSRGATLVSDDLTPLSVEEPAGTVMTTAGVGAVNAWSDVLEHFSLNPVDAIPVRKSLPKYRFSRPVTPPLVMPLDVIVVLTGKRHDGAPVLHGPLAGMHAFATLRSLTRGLRIAEAIQGPSRLMATVSAVASRVPIYTLDRGDRGLAGLDAMVDTLGASAAR